MSLVRRVTCRARVPQADAMKDLVFLILRGVKVVRGGVEESGSGGDSKRNL